MRRCEKREEETKNVKRENKEDEIKQKKRWRKSACRILRSF
ncbi:hypothetical protein THOM_3018 [Trachipleistophora hominis]|uniref:Uncharacterized protein n=1 Tax=Trachipleistophora hominis TaxID=72359 RepID=L7JSP2_TRAHO|nr:hypothetical protein THOM_3018 [Trachipleistophora hominis]